MNYKKKEKTNILSAFGWFVNFLFSGLGIVVFQRINIKHFLSRWNPVEVFEVLILIIFSMMTTFFITKYRVKNKYEIVFKATKSEIERIRCENDELRGILEEKQSIITSAQYLNTKYQDMQGYFKELSSYVLLNKKVNEAHVMRYIQSLSSMIADTTSVDNEVPHITIFFSKNNGSSNEYRPKISNHLTEGEKNVLVYDKESFVASIFKSKHTQYISDVKNRECNQKFDDREQRFNSIWGMPIIIDRKCVYAIVVTMTMAGALDNLDSEYRMLVEVYGYSIGLLLLMQ